MNVTKDHFYAFWRSVVLADFPTAKIKYKSDSLFMKLLGVLLFFNKNFMTQFTTVIGNTIWVPSCTWVDDDPKRAIAICSHEFVHMWDRKAEMLGPIDVFSLSFVAPQIIAVLSLFTFFGGFYLLFLLFLVALLPWPSPWRTHWEVHGYAMTMYIRKLLNDGEYNELGGAAKLLKHFTTGEYYWMCRNDQKVNFMLLEHFESLPESHPAFQGVTQWLKTLQP